MTPFNLPSHAKDIILEDAIRRDLTTARRAALLEILWRERYLTRAQLIARVELRLGRNCFGAAAWQDTFYRDMRVVRQAFEAEGYSLGYSRKRGRAGYYLRGESALSSELSQALRSSAAEVDQRQITIYHRLSPAERFSQGCITSDTARNAVAYRIRQEQSELSLAEANRRALERAYRS